MSKDETRYAVHAYFMQRAIGLAERGWYTTRPNPRVGCVIVADGRIIGEGWHERAGEAHAERRALADVEKRRYAPHGATAYVTLEPCSHTGRTPPCVEALIEAGIARVVVGAQDPNPLVNGRGIARLRDAGVDVVTDVLSQRCEALNTGFNRRMRDGRPQVRVKLAMTLDGRTAAANGESQWITGESARTDVHRLRAEAGAVMVGRGTQQADDPSLNVRLPGDWMQPMRVVLDSDLRMAPDARMLSLPGKTLVVTASTDAERCAALEQAGAQVVVVERDAQGLDLTAVLSELAHLEINDVLVEAGQTLAGGLAQSDLVDEYVIYMAPLLLGCDAPGLLAMPQVQALSDARRLVIDGIEPIGGDWRVRARPRRPRPAAGTNEE